MRLKTRRRHAVAGSARVERRRHRAYESLGFNEATIRRNYYPTADGREDAIIMALPVSM
jgi:hypothetical protein